MTNIIISYRGDDSKLIANQLGDFLIDRYGKTGIQMGLAGVIQPGDDFVDTINSVISKAKVLLVIVGETWLTGEWLKDEYDYDRIALSSALEQRLRIIPILINGASMPSATDLPESLVSFSRRVGITIHEDSFRADANKLVELLAGYIESSATPQHETVQKAPSSVDKPVIASEQPKPISPPVASTPAQIALPKTEAENLQEQLEIRYVNQRKRYRLPPIITLLLMLLPWAVVVQSCGSETATVTGIQLAQGNGADFIMGPSYFIIFLAIVCVIMIGVVFARIKWTSLIMIPLGLLGSFFALFSGTGPDYDTQTMLAQAVALLLMLGQLGMAIWNTFRNWRIRRQMPNL